MPSGRRRSQPDRAKPVFFLDRGLGRYTVAQAIRQRGFDAVPMADAYPGGMDQRTPDDDWILRADTENWIALTKDYSIIYDHRDTLASTSLRVFSLNNAQPHRRRDG